MVKESTNGFKKLALSPTLLSAIEQAGYQNPSPIQSALIPYALAGRDVIGQAQTGTGKTAAFVLPFLQRWKEHTVRGPIALVLAPTRELVVQVAEEAKKLCPSDKCRIDAIYGGERMGNQVRNLNRGCDMVVGTPGRLIDHLRRGTMSLKYVRYVVLDEADRMLDIGFRDDIERILSRCPKKRQTLLLSATLPSSVLRLAQRYLTTPVQIKHQSKKVTVDKIKQYYITIEAHRKFDLLLQVLKQETLRQCIIFTERKRTSEEVYEQLRKEHTKAAVMHGDLPQPRRNRIMQNFRDGKVTCLVATDVVGRGIDVEGVSHIINFDLPRDPDSYVHRIGRTGRMGADGIAISFVTPEEGKELTAVENHINKLLDKYELEDFQGYVQPEPETPKAEKAPPPKKKKYSWRV